MNMDIPRVMAGWGYRLDRKRAQVLMKMDQFFSGG